MSRTFLPILMVTLSACTTHRHIVGEGVVCPHRSHAGVLQPAATEEVVTHERARYADGMTHFEDRRSGAAVYEGDIGFALQDIEAGPADPAAPPSASTHGTRSLSAGRDLGLDR